MFKQALTMLMVLLLTHSVAHAQSKDDRIYEMRTYWAEPGKLDAVNARFRDHTTKLFEKHGFTNVGYWTPMDNPEEKLIYIVSFPSLEAQKKAWAAFLADDEWKQVKAKTEANGKIVKKIESVNLVTTDYSPPIKPAAVGERVFELRTYTTTPGNLDNLNARFRNHTVKLFEKHGMTNIGYWVLAKGQKGDDNTMIYMLAHKSQEAAKASFSQFLKDPAWIAAREESEKKAGGSLTAKGGVQSLFLRATDYSPIR